jgi:Ca2+-binding EF-hand superfamily protein
MSQIKLFSATENCFSRVFISESRASLPEICKRSSKMNKFTKSAIIAVLSVGVAGVAVAQGSGGMHQGGLAKHFDEIDANEDGFVTQDEMSAHQAKRIAQKDTNGDGALSKDEMRNAMMARMEKRLDHMFGRMDKNNDGMVDADEMSQRRMHMFDKVDGNGDGKISRDEAEMMGGHKKNAD